MFGTFTRKNHKGSKKTDWVFISFGARFSICRGCEVRSERLDFGVKQDRVTSRRRALPSIVCDLLVLTIRIDQLMNVRGAIFTVLWIVGLPKSTPTSLATSMTDLIVSRPDGICQAFYLSGDLVSVKLQHL